MPSLSEEKKKHLPELIRHELPLIEIKYITLKMSSTGITLNISKPVFKLGKKRGWFDFRVIKNRTMNRVHSNIYIRDDSQFIEDNISK